MWPIVSGWENIDELVFMHDDASPHFALGVRALLDQKFPGLWLGRRGPHELPAKKSRSHVLSLFHVELDNGEGAPGKSSHMEQLQDRIRNAITVPYDFLHKTVDSIPGRLRKLVDAAGA